MAISFQPLTELIDESLSEDRLMALLSGAFGALGLVLSALGVYGVVAYTVVLRRREIAMRLALGATRVRILTLVLTRVTVLLAIGGIIGIGLNVWAFKYVASLLYDVQPGDPVTLGSSIVILTAVGVLAAGIPAIAASRFEPAALLRES
jgi:ABC-type antimicrobial peptide transport system permease subunit